MTARQVPFNYSHRWIQASMKILEKNYSLFVACSIFSFLTTTAVGLLPYFGPVLSSLLNFIYLVAYLRLGEKILQRETLTFENFLNMAFDQVLLKKLKPYLAIVAIISLIQVVLSVARLYAFLTPVSVLNFLFIGFAAFAAFSQIDETEVEPLARTKKIAVGMWSNVAALLVYGIYMFGIMVGCAMMCIVPLFIFALPLSVAVHYLVYSSIFLNRDIDQTLAEWTVAPEIKPIGDGQV